MLSEVEFQNMKLHEYSENVPHDCYALGKNNPKNCKSMPSKDLLIKPYVLAHQTFYMTAHIKFWVSRWEPSHNGFAWPLEYYDWSLNVPLI